MTDGQVNNVTSEEQEAFKQAKVFTQSEEYFGIPSKVFYNVIAISVVFIIAFKSLYGVIVSIIMFLLMVVPLYHLYQDDPAALKIWQRGLFRKYDRWCAGRADVRKINYLKKENY